MRIRDFMLLALEEDWTYVAVWTANKGILEYQGLYINMPEEFLDAEVNSWNLMEYENKGETMPCICFNVALEI